MEKIRLMAIDMDGTLLTSDKQLTIINEEAVNQAMAKGRQVVLCTGRPLTGIQPFLSRLNFTDEDYIIANNGATILAAKSLKRLLDRGIPPLEMQKIVQIILNLGGEGMIVGADGYYTIKEKANDIIRKDAELIHARLSYRTVQSLADSREVFYKLLVADVKANLDRIEPKILEQLSDHYYVVRSQPYLIEIQAKGVHKGSGLTWLMEKLDFKREEVAAIGDAANDIEMLQVAGFALAMGNASDEVQAMADKVVDSNDDNGVAQAIHYIWGDDEEGSKTNGNNE